MSVLEQAIVEEFALREVAPGVLVRPMLTLTGAIDLFVDGDCVDRGLAKRTRLNYARALDKFCDRFPRNWDVAKVTDQDCRAFLATYAHLSNNYRATIYAALNGLFNFLDDEEKIKTNPMKRVKAPKRIPADELDVVTINPLDVPTLIREARPGTERNCIAILAYTGARRHAAALLKIDDYRDGRMRFREKGGKTSWKPIAAELCEILDASITAGEISSDQPYLIPPAGPLAKQGERDDRVVWRVVKEVAERCRLEATTHAFRRAFAVFYLLNNPGDSRGLQKAMGHRNPATTEVYARHLDDELAMAPVKALSWLGNKGLEEIPETAGNTFASSSHMGAGGFEPPKADSRGGKRA